jgi:hypothetical protein
LIVNCLTWTQGNIIAGGIVLPAVLMNQHVVTMVPLCELVA